MKKPSLLVPLLSKVLLSDRRLGGWRKEGGRVQMGKNKQGWTCMEDSDWADMHAKQTIKQSHTQLTN